MTLLQELQSFLGSAHVLTGENAEPYILDWRCYRGRALAVARPSSAEEVAAVLRLCHRHGGDPVDCAAQPRARHWYRDTITVEAGYVLQAVQEAVEKAGRLFPLSLAAEAVAP